jgi:biotin carboxylase
MKIRCDFALICGRGRMMDTVVFLETQKSGSSREAIEAAERLGFYTVLFTNRKSFIEKREAFPDVHLMRYVDLTNLDVIRDNINQLIQNGLNIKGIVGFVDPFVHTSCVLAEEFGVNHFSTAGIHQIQNKITSRNILENTPYTPDFSIFEPTMSVDDLVEHTGDNLGLIVKLPSSTGSKDVFFPKTIRELKRVIKRMQRRNPGDPILIEEYINGPQYLTEVIVQNGELKIIAVFEQEITYGERFIITGYNLKLNLDQVFFNSLKEAAAAIVYLHGLKDGACHLEMRYRNNQWKLIEINPRISGGSMNRMIQFGLGINLIEETLKMAIGMEPDFTIKLNKHIFTQYVTVTSTGTLIKVTGKKNAFESQGVEEVYVKPKKGAFLQPPTSMGHRYAYVIATGETEEEARQNAKNAASKIQFYLEE